MICNRWPPYLSTHARPRCRAGRLAPRDRGRRPADAQRPTPTSRCARHSAGSPPTGLAASSAWPRRREVIAGPVGPTPRWSLASKASRSADRPRRSPACTAALRSWPRRRLAGPELRDGPADHPRTRPRPGDARAPRARGVPRSIELALRWEADDPNAIWQADHIQLDVMILDAAGRPARPWLTLDPRRLQPRRRGLRRLPRSTIRPAHRPRAFARRPGARPTRRG
jgi:hypothetical protein